MIEQSYDEIVDMIQYVTERKALFNPAQNYKYISSLYGSFMVEYVESSFNSIEEMIKKYEPLHHNINKKVIELITENEEILKKIIKDEKINQEYLSNENEINKIIMNPEYRDMFDALNNIWESENSFEIKRALAILQIEKIKEYLDNQFMNSSKKNTSFYEGYKNELLTRYLFWETLKQRSSHKEEEIYRSMDILKNIQESFTEQIKVVKKNKLFLFSSFFKFLNLFISKVSVFFYSICLSFFSTMLIDKSTSLFENINKIVNQYITEEKITIILFIIQFFIFDRLVDHLINKYIWKKIGKIKNEMKDLLSKYNSFIFLYNEEFEKVREIISVS